ncbi:uncharacterized membrane protein YgaE (UPF0421/DUF939 family) [Knoellia remsis]|uniref:Uncharacterized membrane protein YgaE (UPF0421/DUF939 family) n=2 Tax=Knoellia remsis TaxID=407159 RepID=A0A2T0UUA3_9MICO|nr:uncharacterized membrane protein YgaE (UPF0421/DUF939 family) [Knoellia remsis]
MVRMPSARPTAQVTARVAARSRREARIRRDRLMARLVFILQCGLGAALAWWVASSLPGHDQPFFAPVTAIITLGMSYGQRVRRAVEVMVGVAVGVLVGDVFVHVFGTGVIQVLVVVLIAMGVASLVGAGILITIQAGVQAAIVTTLVAAPGQAFTRWVDAVVGGVVALTISVLAPATGLHRPRQRAAATVQEVADILRDTAAALRASDVDLGVRTLDRARRSERLLDDLRSIAAEGVAVVRLSPFRRRHLPGVQEISSLLDPLDRAIRNLRVLVRRASVSIRRGETVPPAYVALIDDLATSCDDIARQLHERREPVAARPGLEALGERSTVLDRRSSLSGEVIRAQVRSMIVDLLALTGLEIDEARALVPVSPNPTGAPSTAEGTGDPTRDGAAGDGVGTERPES